MQFYEIIDLLSTDSRYLSVVELLEWSRDQSMVSAEEGKEQIPGELFLGF